VQNWSYAELPRILADGRPVRTYTVATEAELDRVLGEVETANEFTFIEMVMESLDAPAGLLQMGPLVAAFDCGERGPQKKSVLSS
jgi:TPP-dependent 2-oxoacid decarboxylase